MGSSELWGPGAAHTAESQVSAVPPEETASSVGLGGPELCVCVLWEGDSAVKLVGSSAP